MVEEKMASSGAVQVRDIEEVQLRIVQMVRQMEEQGKAIIVRERGILFTDERTVQNRNLAPYSLFYYQPVTFAPVDGS